MLCLSLSYLLNGPTAQTVGFRSFSSHAVVALSNVSWNLPIITRLCLNTLQFIIIIIIIIVFSKIDRNSTKKYIKTTMKPKSARKSYAHTAVFISLVKRKILNKPLIVFALFQGFRTNRLKNYNLITIGHLNRMTRISHLCLG